MSCICGIDLSLTSPGISVYEYSSDLWYLYAFSPWKRMFKNFNHTYIQLFPRIPSAATTDNAIRFKYVVDNILSIVSFWYEKYPDLIVGLEGYAFSKDSAHAFKLMELGGILKYRLYFDLHIKCRILPPKYWKKYACGNGNATKLDVALFMTPIIKFDLFTMFDLPKQIKVKKPIEDIYDSSGVVEAIKNIEANIEIFSKKRKISKKSIIKKVVKKEPKKKHIKIKGEMISDPFLLIDGHI